MSNPGDFVRPSSALTSGGFIMLGTGKCRILTMGVIMTTWEQAIPALRYGWRLHGMSPNGFVFVRSPGFDAPWPTPSRR